MIIDTTNTESIIAFILMLLSALYAWYQNREKKTVIAAMSSGSIESQNPAVIAKIPERIWKMNDVTKQNILSDATPTNRARILSQINNAEAQYLTHYRINFVGGYYVIDYGLIMSGVGNPSKDVGSDGANLADQFYTHPRTGRVWANREMAEKEDGAIV